MKAVMKKGAKKEEKTMPVREVTVLLEDIRSQFRTIIEDHQWMKKRLNATFEQTGKNA